MSNDSAMLIIRRTLATTLAGLYAASANAEYCERWYTGYLSDVPIRLVLSPDTPAHGRIDTTVEGSPELRSLLGIRHDLWSGALCVGTRPHGNNGLVVTLSVDSGWREASIGSLPCEGGPPLAEGNLQRGGDRQDGGWRGQVRLQRGPQTRLGIELEPTEDELSCLEDLPSAGASEFYCGDGGCAPESILVAVDARREEEARAVFRDVGAYRVLRCADPRDCLGQEAESGTTLFHIWVPGMTEVEAVRTLERHPAVLRAEREGNGAGAAAEGANLSVRRFFSGRQPDDLTAARLIRDIFTNYFRTVSRANNQVSVNFVHRRAFFYRIEVEGPSRFLARGERNTWESLVFEVIMTQQFMNRSSDIMTVFVSVPSAKSAVWPEGRRPHPARLREFEGNALNALQLRLISAISMSVSRAPRQRAAP